MRKLAAAVPLAIGAASVAWWFFYSAQTSEKGATVSTQHAEAQLIAQRNAVPSGAPVLVALRLKAKPGWHTYWRNPADSGQPSSIEWKLPAGFSAGPIRWPVPQRFVLGPLANYGYEDEVLLASEIRVPPTAKGRVGVAAIAKWLVCDPDHCIPEQADLSLTLTIDAGEPGKSDPKFESIPLPQPAPQQWRLAARRDGDRVLLEVAGATEPALYFFPYDEGKVQHAALQPLERMPDGIRLAIPVSTQPVGEFNRVRGLLAADARRAYEIDVPIEK